MKPKWKLLVYVVMICLLAILIWNGTAERRYVARVRGLDWQESCKIHIFDYRLNEHWADVTDSALQKAIFDGLKSLSYEGEPPSAGPYGGAHIAENTWHVNVYSPDDGWNSLVLQGKDMHGEPISWVPMDDGAVVLVGRTADLLAAVKNAFENSGERK